MTTAGITSLDTSRERTEEDKIVSCKGTVNVVMNLQWLNYYVLFIDSTDEISLNLFASNEVLVFEIVW